MSRESAFSHLYSLHFWQASDKLECTTSYQVSLDKYIKPELSTEILTFILQIYFSFFTQATEQMATCQLWEASLDSDSWLLILNFMNTHQLEPLIFTT